MPRRERRTSLRHDGGASAAEYGAILILVAALAAVFTVVALPERVKTTTAAAICQLFGDTEDCPDGWSPAPDADDPPGENTPPDGAPPENGDPALPDPDPQGQRRIRRRRHRRRDAAGDDAYSPSGTRFPKRRMVI